MQNRFIGAVVLLLAGGLFASDVAAQQARNIKWKHLSTTKGDLAAPNSGKEQTASIVCDIDKDGVNDLGVTCLPLSCFPV